ncbi:hypothetical protein Cgig2_010384 [Carnegiea gigantea]|uniref:DYW domain-containing protein n=1 Tax=Carnegiea gigantea TaxID=171969 RepID=A0A9Q1QFG7_9CARY|nr:hypothetical protein Cgig2_010384 [Carnegiea gigantea]
MQLAIRTSAKLNINLSPTPCISSPCYGFLSRHRLHVSKHVTIPQSLGTLLQPLRQNPPSVFSYALIFQYLTAYSNKNLLKLGHQVHAHMVLHGVMPSSFTAAKLVAMYASSGYTQNGFASRALDLFDQMMLENSEVKPNWVTIVSILPACAHSAALDRGKRIHEICRHNGLDSHSSVQTALIGMYAKCGSLADAKQCFDKISPGNRGLVAWNNMITAYASHGRGRECVLAFQDMEASGVQPDAITFTALLSGCSHSGLADVGLSYFYSMKNQYSVVPRLEHYACVVDLLSRVGQLVEAKETIDQMPMQPGPSVWGALLAASHRCRNLQIAEIAAKQLFVLEPENTGNYVLLSNMYAEAGKWEEVNNLRVFLKGHGMRKSPGCSWIEINGNAHLFIGGDTAHPQAREIYKLLEELPEKIKTIGYTPNTSFSLHDISEEEKMLSLTTHSEKLAIAFGILNTRTGQVLRVTKNLRICGDCHTFAKFVSDIYKREIIVRDVNRFHHFQDGFCSCGDFW